LPGVIFPLIAARLRGAGLPPVIAGGLIRTRAQVDEILAAGAVARLRAPRAQSLREPYLKRLAEHRETIRAACAARGWGFALHRTDRSAAQALLALRSRLAGPGPTTTAWSA